MLSKEKLRQRLGALDGKGYKAYKELQGQSYNFGLYQLFIDHVQGDPFAAPSRLRVRMGHELACWPRELFNTKTRCTAMSDFLARRLALAIARAGLRQRGTGKSGLITVDRCGQEILERTAVVITEDYFEARLSFGLPAAGRRILGREATEMFFRDLPLISGQALVSHQDGDRVAASRHVATAEDQEALRQQLKENGLVAFIANGSILPRRSGVSDAPLPADKAVVFKSPPSLEVELMTPNHGKVQGLGMPEGINLIVGGGYHGKSTLLKAIERGIYNHIPGDGREGVVTVGEAIKIRAEDGRRVERVNISPFISNLPFGQDTVSFSSEQASGSTSQAANIVEALEMGASLLLLDEDTSATNFMIRDRRMQQLVTREKEPITPFIDRVRQLKKIGVSSILVVGGAGDYLDVADTVVMMYQYEPRDVTLEARHIAASFPSGRIEESGDDFGRIIPRTPLPESFNPKRYGRIRIKSMGTDEITFGYENIDLSAVEQIVDPSQNRAIGDIIRYAAQKYCNGRRSIKEILNLVENDIDKYGLDVISPFYGQHPGDYARPRPLEVAAAINRLRTLTIKP